MSFLSRLFGSRSSEGALEKRLQRLEAEADSAAPAYVGTSYNRAGDLALKAGQQGRAVEYYGRSIDAFLEDGQREAARGVANKIIRVRPSAVRTLCTLMWLDVAARHSATALLHLRDYVQAAKDVDEYSLAASQIYEMARLVPDSELVGAVADALDGLDFSSQAADVREWMKSNGSPDAITDPEELSRACLRAAVKSNERSAHAIGEEPSRGDVDENEIAGEEAGDDDTGEGDTGEDDALKPKYRWD